MKYRWLNIDAETMGLSGHPVQIRLLPPTEDWRFQIVIDGKVWGNWFSLDYAKDIAQRKAAELAQFRGEPTDEQPKIPAQ